MNDDDSTASTMLKTIKHGKIMVKLQKTTHRKMIKSWSKTMAYHHFNHGENDGFYNKTHGKI
jgi:hypothetical protein